MSADPKILTDPDRRRVPRQRVLKGALMVFGAYTQTFDCVVRNLSDDGAKITLPSTLGVPAEFHLLIPAEQRIVPAREVWRTTREIGVAFTGPWAHHSSRG